MHKVTSTTLLALLLSLTATAQISIKAGVTLGGTYGSAEEFDGDKIESIDPAVGYQFGITTTLVDLPAFALRAELLYENRRGVKNVNFNIQPGPDQGIRSDVEFNNSFRYLSVPVLASFGGEGLQIYVGPSFSYLLGATANTTTTTSITTIAGEQTATIEEEIDLIDDDRYEDSYINRFNAAANVGFMVPILPSASLDIRLYHTITDVTNNEEDRSIIDRITRPQDIRLRDDNDSTVGLQANLVFRF